MTKAAKWYRLASLGGLGFAQELVGKCYLNGDGVPKDEIEAYAYFNLAAVQHESARKKLEELEEILPTTARLKGQQRSRQIQKEIEERHTNKTKKPSR